MPDFTQFWALLTLRLSEFQKREVERSEAIEGFLSLTTAHSGHLKKFRNFEKVSCFSYNQTCLIAYQTNDTKRETAPVPENLHALNEMYINWKWLTLTCLELIIN